MRKIHAALLAVVLYAKRPKQEDMPLEGAGVAPPKKDKKLEELGDEFIEARDGKAELATKMTALETKMLDRMAVLGLTEYRFGDQIMYQKQGKLHVKIKTVKNEGTDNGDGGEGDPADN